jgi:hypothetical protein
MIAFVTSLLTALANIRAIAELVNKFAGAVTLWYVQNQKSKTLSAISDAAALSARAKTQEERFNAAQAWRDALSRPRITD